MSRQDCDLKAVRIQTASDLRQVIEDWMGPEADSNDVDRVTDYLQFDSDLDYGQDWGPWLRSLDLWEINVELLRD